MRPIGYAVDVPMLHGIEMNVIDMPFEICLVSDGVFPIASLPNAFLRLLTLLAERGCASRPLEKPLLIERQRVAKSASSSGNAQRA